MAEGRSKLPMRSPTRPPPHAPRLRRRAAVLAAVAASVASCSVVVDVPNLSRNYGADATSPVPGDATPADAGAATRDADSDAPLDYPSIVRADQPIAYFRLGEPSGTPAARDEIGGAAATYVGPVSLGVLALVPGDADTAAAFNGQSAGLDVGDRIDFSGRDPFSFEAWVKVAALGATNGTLFHKEGVSGGRQQFGAFVNATDGLVFERWVAGAEVTARTTIVANTTHHVVLTYDGAELVVWLDSVKRATAGDARSQAPKPGPLGVGWDPAAGAGRSFFAGTLDEVAFYARALGPDEVARHFAAGR